jgi:hypothetical protein
MVNAKIVMTGSNMHRRTAVLEARIRPLTANHRIIGRVATRTYTGARDPVVNIAPTTRVNATIGAILPLTRQPRPVLYPMARNATNVRNTVYPEI